MLRLASTLRAKGQMDECRLTVERASRVLYVGTRDATGDRRHNATLNHNRSRRLPESRQRCRQFCCKKSARGEERGCDYVEKTAMKRRGGEAGGVVAGPTWHSRPAEERSRAGAAGFTVGERRQRRTDGRPRACVTVAAEYGISLHNIAAEHSIPD